MSMRGQGTAAPPQQLAGTPLSDLDWAGAPLCHQRTLQHTAEGQDAVHFIACTLQTGTTIDDRLNMMHN